MATTKNGTYYPDDYNKTADVPEDMKKLAESVDTQIDDIKTDMQSIKSDVTTNRHIINLLEIKDQEKEESIEENTTNIETLQAENKNLKEEIESYKNSLPRETQTGEYITMQNTADKVKFKDFVLGGNSKQENRSGKNKLNIEGLTGNYVTDKEATTGTFAIQNSWANTIMTNENLIKSLKPNTSYKCIAKVTLLEKPGNAQASPHNAIIALLHANNNYITNVLAASTKTEKDNWIVNTSKTLETIFTTMQDLTGVKLVAYNYLDAENTPAGKFKIENAMILEATENDETYEPYGASPSPEFPSQIENVYAKNLVGGKWTNGLINPSGDLSNTDQNLYRHFKKILKAGTYTYSYSVAKGYLTQVRAVNLTTQSNLTVTDKTFTLEEDAEISLGFRKNDSTEWDIGENLEDIRFMLEEGTEATDYIPNGVVVTVANKNIANIDEIYMNMKSYSHGNCTEETVDGRDCIRFANTRFRPDVENPFNLINYKYKEKTAYTFRILAKAGELVYEGSGTLTFQAIYTDGSKISASKYKANATNFVELRFVTDPEKTVARVGFNYGTSCQWYMDKSSIFIAEGDTTDYVANEQQQVVFPLAQGQKLYKGDYLADDGIHHVRKQEKLLNKVWNKYNATDSKGNTFGFSSVLFSTPKQSNNTKDFALSNIMNQQMRGNVSTYDLEGFYIGVGKGIYIKIKQELIPNGTIEELLLLLQNTDATIEYELAEEEIEPYTEEQQEAYNKLKELTTYAGQTNIYSTNNIKPVFTVTGIKDVNSLITQVNQLILEEGGN